MDKKENQVNTLTNLIMSVLYAFVFSFISLLVYNGKITFGWYDLWLPTIFAAFFGYLVVTGLPLIPWGIGIALKLKAKPGSFLFNTIFAFVLALIFALIMSIVMGLFSAVIIPSIQYNIGNVAPAMEVIKGSFTWTGFPLFFLIAWVISTFIVEPIQKLARKLCNAPEPQYQ